MKILSFDTGYNIGWSLTDIVKPKLLTFDFHCIGSKLLKITH